MHVPFDPAVPLLGMSSVEAIYTQQQTLPSLPPQKGNGNTFFVGFANFNGVNTSTMINF